MSNFEVETKGKVDIAQAINQEFENRPEATPEEIATAVLSQMFDSEYMTNEEFKAEREAWLSILVRTVIRMRASKAA